MAQILKNTKRLTPEEKLLNIIEDPDDKTSAAGREASSQEKKDMWDKNPILYRIFVIVCSAFALLLIFYIAQKIGKATSSVTLTFQQENAPANTAELNTTNSAFGGTSSPKPLTTTATASQREGLSLVGILWAEKPQAIIEDRSSAKTYLVYEGDPLDKYVVKKITQNQVELRSENENKILL